MLRSRLHRPHLGGGRGCEARSTSRIRTQHGLMPVEFAVKG